MSHTLIEQDNFPDYNDGKPNKLTVKTNPIGDTEEFGGSDFPSYDGGDGPVDIWKAAEKGEEYLSMISGKLPPIITPEIEAQIKTFYDANPELKQQPSRNASAWIQTYTGKKFFPLDPKVEDICIDDIAHALSNICRFTGHCSDFYSVAQHSVLVSYICDYQNRLAGLLHDASEAYCQDIASPIKRAPTFDAYRAVEVVIQRAINSRFGLIDAEPFDVKRADQLLLSTEARDLMPSRHPDWKDIVSPLPFKIVALPPKAAKELFLARFAELTQ
jgi:hypothetical protein